MKISLLIKYRLDYFFTLEFYFIYLQYHMKNHTFIYEILVVYPCGETAKRLWRYTFV